LLDEAEAFLNVEKLDHALAGADDLRGHTGETAAACSAAACSAAAWATGAAGSAAAATWAARAAAAEAITPAAAETVTTTAEFARRRKAIVPAAKRIKTFFAKAVAFIFAAPTSPIVTHKSVRTLSHCPFLNAPMAGTASRTGHRRAELANRRARSCGYSAQRVALRTILPVSAGPA
jgi:hypothetical protein